MHLHAVDQPYASYATCQQHPPGSKAYFREGHFSGGRPIPGAPVLPHRRVEERDDARRAGPPVQSGMIERLRVAGQTRHRSRWLHPRGATLEPRDPAIAHAQEPLRLRVFPSGSNWPVWVAQEKGFLARIAWHWPRQQRRVPERNSAPCSRGAPMSPARRSTTSSRISRARRGAGCRRHLARPRRRGWEQQRFPSARPGA